VASVVSSNGLDSRIPERAGNALADNSNNAVLSPDGQALLFSDGAAVVGVNYSLCLHKPIQSPVVRLGDGNAQALSPDGKWALSMVATSPRRLTLYPTGAGEPRPLREWQHPKLRHCHFFSNGKRVLACRSEAWQTSRCYVQELTGGLPVPRHRQEQYVGLHPRTETPFFARDADGKFSIYSLTDNAPRAVSGLTANDEVIR
jgi:hypothetical protein